jgi:hypothetical protein
MPGSQVLFRWPAWAIAGLLAVAIVVAFAIGNAFGARATKRAPVIGPVETMASGLLGLLLAFNFSIAQSRFDARQTVLVREANAIGTAYLRCSVLAPTERQVCRDLLRRYATLRLEAYDAFARDDASAVLRALADGERTQQEIWSLVSAAARATPTPEMAIVLEGMNAVIDFDAERRASIRETVPQAVGFAIILVCLSWALLLGYSSGRRQRERAVVAWSLTAMLIAIVFGVALDFDRPCSGFIRTTAAEVSMANLVRSMETAPKD